MRRIWKFRLDVDGADGDKIAVAMPAGARVLHLGLQMGRPCLWADVDPEAEVVTRIVQIVGTGFEPPADGVYLGTLMMRSARGGELVFHFYLLPDARMQAMMDKVESIFGPNYQMAGVRQRSDGGRGDVGGGR